MNRREMREEVRYVYPEGGGETIQRLGIDWEEALAFWLADSRDSARLREQLAATMRGRFKAMTTFARKKELGGQLTAYLASLRQAAELGVDDPTFQRYDGIRKRIVLRWGLPVESGESAMHGRGEADERFLQFARAAVSSGAGQLTQPVREMLEKQREILQLTRDRRTHY